MLENLKEKFKSWPLWLAIAALIIFIVQQIWGLDISQQVNDFLTAALPVLIAFGIVNNPNSRETL